MKKAATAFNEFKIGPDEPVYASGVVSRLLDVPLWILKKLDREGVVSPPRTKGTNRLYSKRELKKLEHVWALMNDKGINIAGVKAIIKLETSG